MHCFLFFFSFGTEAYFPAIFIPPLFFATAAQKVSALSKAALWNLLSQYSCATDLFWSFKRKLCKDRDHHSDLPSNTTEAFGFIHDSFKLADWPFSQLLTPKAMARRLFFLSDTYRTLVLGRVTLTSQSIPPTFTAINPWGSHSTFICLSLYLSLFSPSPPATHTRTHTPT